MKAVVQEEKTGCGIAACAAISGVSYKKAKAIANSLGIFADDKTLWSETSHVQRLLTHCGTAVACPKTPFTNWHALPDLALLAIKWHEEKGRRYWHWVVFVRDASGCYVLDSKETLKNNIRKDFGRMQPKWYLKVNR